MSVHEVNCSIDVVDVDSAWAHIRDFGSDWHPDIVNNTLSVSYTHLTLPTILLV